jgi:hypothetical protein
VYFRRRRRQDSALGHYLAQVWDQRQRKLAYQEEFDAAEEVERGIAEATAEAQRRRRARFNGWTYDPWTGEATFEGEQMARHGHDHGHASPGREGEEKEEEKEAEEEEEKEEDANLPGLTSPLATSPSENIGLPKWKKLAKEERWRFDPWSGARLPGGDLEDGKLAPLKLAGDGPPLGAGVPMKRKLSLIEAGKKRISATDSSLVPLQKKPVDMAGPPLKAFPKQHGDPLIDPKSRMSPPKPSSLKPITPASRGPPSSLLKQSASASSAVEHGSGNAPLRWGTAYMKHLDD